MKQTMKTPYILMTLLALVFSTQLMAQNSPIPEGMSYQGMLLNASQEAFGTNVQQVPVANKAIRVRFEFTQGSSSTPIFAEEQNLKTDMHGIFATIIGSGTPSVGSGLGDIPWDKDSTLLLVSIDQGKGFVAYSKQKLWSTAYSFHAGTANKALNDRDTSATNELQYITLSGDVIALSATGSSISLKPWSDGIAKNSSDITTLGSNLSTEIARAKAAEAQNASDISKNASDITALSNSNTQLGNDLAAEVLRAKGAETNLAGAQTLLSNAIDDEAFRAKAAEAQNASDIAQNSSDITKNASDLAAEITRAKAAEATLTATANQLGSDINAETTRAKTAETALSNANSIQNDTLVAHNKRISANAADQASLKSSVDTHISNDADLSATNELQTLTLSGTTLSISNGNSITLASGGKSDLQLTGHTLKLSDPLTSGNSVQIDTQSLRISAGYAGNGTNITITGSNTVTVGGGIDWLYDGYTGNSGNVYNSMALGPYIPTFSASNWGVGVESSTLIGRGIVGGLTASGSIKNTTVLGATAMANMRRNSGSVAIGSNAMYSDTGGTNNVAIGYNAMYHSRFEGWSGWSTFNSNVGVGSSALWTNSGGSNTAMGYRAMGAYNSMQKSVGRYNVGIGADAFMDAGYKASYNVGVGMQALSTGMNGHTGNYNTAIGTQAGYNGSSTDSFTGSNNLYLGYYTTATSNAMSNTIILGNTSITDLRCKVSLTTTSDARTKKNVRSDVQGLAFIMKLAPVTYNYDLDAENQIVYKGHAMDTLNWKGKYDVEKTRFSGFLAQDVERAAQAVNYDFSGVSKPSEAGGLYGLKYAEFVVPLVKAVQEQQAQLEAQQQQIEELQAMVNALLKQK